MDCRGVENRRKIRRIWKSQHQGWQFDCHGESKLGWAPWKISSRSCLSGGRGHQSCEEFGRSDGDKEACRGPTKSSSCRTQTGEISASWNKGGIWGDRSRERSTNGILVGRNSSQEWKCSIESWTTNATTGYGPTLGDSDDACDGWRQHADFGIWFSTVSRAGILLWSTSAYGQSHGDDSSSFARSDGSSSLKEVEYRSLQMIGDWHKIRERKSLGSCRFAFKRSDHFFWISSWQAEKKVCFAKNCRFRSG